MGEARALLKCLQSVHVVGASSVHVAVDVDGWRGHRGAQRGTLLPPVACQYQ